MKRTFLNSFAISLCLIGLYSCGSSTEYSLATPEGIAQVKDAITKEVDSRKEIHSISFQINNFKTFSNNVGGILLSIGSSPSTETSGSILMPYDVEEISISTLPELKSTTKQATSMGKRNAAPLSVFDFSKITPYLDESLTYVPEDYEYRGVGSYSLTVTTEGYVRHYFKTQITAKEGSTSMKGKRVETTYYELSFSTDEAGKLEFLED